eukprot:gb/GECH01003749.1/.p1 GENE.gb/GECH01003749.1/~~gb/GECH01003749.1/.p1  ORF type:complete len:375 (+),score=46.61 gb/GECH01003749.1/:1-1125(+)
MHPLLNSDIIRIVLQFVSDPDILQYRGKFISQGWFHVLEQDNSFWQTYLHNMIFFATKTFNHQQYSTLFSHNDEFEWVNRIPDMWSNQEARTQVNWLLFNFNHFVNNERSLLRSFIHFTRNVFDNGKIPNQDTHMPRTDDYSKLITFIGLLGRLQRSILLFLLLFIRVKNNDKVLPEHHHPSQRVHFIGGNARVLFPIQLHGIHGRAAPFHVITPNQVLLCNGNQSNMTPSAIMACLGITPEMISVEQFHLWLLWLVYHVNQQMRPSPLELDVFVPIARDTIRTVKSDSCKNSFGAKFDLSDISVLNQTQRNGDPRDRNTHETNHDTDSTINAEELVIEQIIDRILRTTDDTVDVNRPSHRAPRKTIDNPFNVN